MAWLGRNVPLRYRTGMNAASRNRLVQPQLTGPPSESYASLSLARSTPQDLYDRQSTEAEADPPSTR